MRARGLLRQRLDVAREVALEARRRPRGIARLAFGERPEGPRELSAQTGRPRAAVVELESHELVAVCPQNDRAEWRGETGYVESLHRGFLSVEVRPAER